MALDDVYEFDLVPVTKGAVIATDRWPALHHLLLEMQPARSVTALGEPPRAIHVEGFGGAEVAPGVLDEASRLAGTALVVVIEDSRP